MADERFDIEIRTRADTSGAKQMRAALEELKAEEAKSQPLGAGPAGAPALKAALEQLKQVESQAHATGAAIDAALDNAAHVRAYYDAMPGEHGTGRHEARDAAFWANLEKQLGTEKKLTAEEEKQIALEAKKASMETARLAVLELEEQANAALLKGENDKAAALNRELLVQREYLMLLRSGVVSEEEAWRMAALRVSAKEKEAAIEQQLAAQAKVDRERQKEALAIQRERNKELERQKNALQYSSFGDAGDSRLGKLFKGLGLGGVGVSAGVGAAFGHQIVAAIEGVLEYQHKAELSAIKLGEEVREIGARWREAAGGVKDMNDLLALQARMQGDIDRFANQQADSIKGQYSAIDARIDFLKDLGNRIQRALGGSGGEDILLLDTLGEQQQRAAEAMENERKRMFDMGQEFLRIREMLAGKDGQEAITGTAQRIGDLNDKLRKLAPSTAENRSQIAAYQSEIKLLTGALLQLATAEQHAANERDERRDKAEAEREEKNRATEEAVAALYLRRSEEEEKLAKQRDEALKDAKEDADLARARLADEDELVIKLEAEKAVREKIDALKRSGINDAELNKQIAITGELQKQAKLKELEEKRQAAREAVEDTIDAADPDVDTKLRGSKQRTKIDRSWEKFEKQLNARIRAAKKLDPNYDEADARERARRDFDEKVREERGRFGATTAADPSKNKGAIHAPFPGTKGAPAGGAGGDAGLAKAAEQTAQSAQAAAASAQSLQQVPAAVDRVSGAIDNFTGAVLARLNALEAKINSIPSKLGSSNG